MKPCQFLFLAQEDVVKAGGLEMAETLKAVEDGFRLHGNGQTVQPPKINLRKGPAGSAQAAQGLIMAMPGYLGGEYDVVGIKWVLGMAENPSKHGIPRSTALTILNDAETGWPLALLDGTVVNAVRTGAVSGVGAKYLAQPDSQVLGLIGAGPQGRMQVTGIVHALPAIQEIRIYDLNEERATALAAELADGLGRKVTVATSAKEAAEAADIVVTATIAKEPYLKREWLKKGCLYVDVASHDAVLDVYLTADKIYTDDWGQMKAHGSGVLIDAYKEGKFPEARITGDFGGVVAGRDPSRGAGDDLIIFKHIGMAATDLPEAYRIYKAAVAKGLGQTLTLFENPIWG
jgi:ornithine cyclodeaminase/alanine dehydrogenase-like protein (mu-crystallin family)